MANLAAWLGNKQGHHPDIAFGWGYCTVTFTTHEAGGLDPGTTTSSARPGRRTRWSPRTGALAVEA